MNSNKTVPASGGGIFASSVITTEPTVGSCWEYIPRKGPSIFLKVREVKPARAGAVKVRHVFWDHINRAGSDKMRLDRWSSKVDSGKLIPADPLRLLSLGDLG